MKVIELYGVTRENRRDILQNYNHNEETFTRDVNNLKEWIKTQPHLPEILDDSKIGLFLLSSKCSLERAKTKIDMYYTMRSKIPDMYEDINPKLPHMKRNLDASYILPIPKLTKELYRISFVKVRDPKLIETLDFQKYLSHNINISEIRLNEDFMLGDIVVVDMQDISFSYTKKVAPSAIIKSVTLYEKIYSFSVKKIYVLNAPPFIGPLVNILKSVIKPKIFQRIHFCEGSAILNEVLEPHLIPKEYGGQGPSLEELNEMMKHKLVEYQERFDQMDLLQVDESRRPEPLKNDDFLGFHGNFKTLSFD